MNFPKKQRLTDSATGDRGATRRQYTGETVDMADLDYDYDSDSDW